MHTTDANHAKTSTAARNGSGFVRRDRNVRRRPVVTTAPIGSAVASVFVADTSAMAAVAKLKGIEAKAIAFACALPTVAVNSFLAGKNVSMRAGSKQAIAAFLGVDLATNRLSGNQVHFFDLAHLGRFTSRKAVANAILPLAPLLRGAKVMKLGFPTDNVFSRKLGPATYVLQNDFLRAAFVNASASMMSAGFDVAMVAPCKWAFGTEAESAFDVVQESLAKHIHTLDVTPNEFDEIFDGTNAVLWSDVEACARANQVTKSEIVAWVKTVSANRRAIKRKNTENSLMEQVSETRAHVVERKRQASM